MATDKDFIEYVYEQVGRTGDTRYRKMFGDYMVYVNNKPIFLVCDNTVYIKKHECLKELLQNAEVGIPYKGAKEHYIVDIDDFELCEAIVKAVEPIIEVPRSRRESRANHSKPQ